MLLRIAYCDDEPQNGKKIEDYIKQLMIQIDDEIKYDFYVSGMVLLEKIKMDPTCYDVIFLDMEMPQMNGLDLADSIRKVSSNDILITYLTSYPEYMQQSFGVQPFQYLLKPVSFEQFKKEVLRTVAYIRKDDRNVLAVDIDTGVEMVLRLKDIVSMEKQKGSSVIEITLEKDIMNVRGNISDYEAMLLENNFIKINRSCIVNMKYIHSFFKQEIHMTNGKKVVMSRRKVSEVKERFTRFLVLGEERK